MPKDESFGYVAYAGLLSLLFLLMMMHIFGLYSLRIDKFTFYVISLIFLLLLLPIVKYIKFFGLVEVRKEYASLERQVEQLSVKTAALARTVEQTKTAAQARKR